jgi:hypothetical protein
MAETGIYSAAVSVSLASGLGIIEGHPAIQVQVGRQRYTPQQRMLSAEETLHILQEYQQHHPWRFRELMHLAGYSCDGTSDGLRAVSQVLRGVAFRP